MRHARTLRVTHWVFAAAFVALAVSGGMILTAHPRFYWGESGFFDTPALFELPMKPILKELWVRAQGRNVHFLAAWIAVLNGLGYAAWGLATGHFRRRFGAVDGAYNPQQRMAYLVVVFGLTPLAVLSGLTMSPAVTAAFPQLFTLFGGRQSARTIHFVLAAGLVVFGLGHVGMVWRAGFWKTLRPMIGGQG